MLDSSNSPSCSIQLFHATVPSNIVTSNSMAWMNAEHSSIPCYSVDFGNAILGCLPVRSAGNFLSLGRSSYNRHVYVSFLSLIYKSSILVATILMTTAGAFCCPRDLCGQNFFRMPSSVRVVLISIEIIDSKCSAFRCADEGRNVCYLVKRRSSKRQHGIMTANQTSWASVSLSAECAFVFYQQLMTENRGTGLGKYGRPARRKTQ